MRPAANDPRKLHGGPDAQGPARFDFSTNGNAAGPLPSVARAIAASDRTRYPDPTYQHLRECLAAFHGVAPERVVVAASGSEFIDRLTRVSGRGRVWVPHPGYGDYAHAAGRQGREVECYGHNEPPGLRLGDLCWLTLPASPSGRAAGPAARAVLSLAERSSDILVAVDRAYEPLRFDGSNLESVSPSTWQLWSPNKACGLTGVRGAYVLAPPEAQGLCDELIADAPSWPIGADGVAMLEAFTKSAARDELRETLTELQRWRQRLADALRELAWDVGDQDSVTPFFMARPPSPLDVPKLRGAGIKLRDAASLGAAGWFRLSAQAPDAIAALKAALA